MSAWIPVALLGLCAALLYRRTGWLIGAIAMHFAYNFVIATGL